MGGSPNGISSSADYKSAAELGVTTGSNGLLSLNTTTFQAALDANVEGTVIVEYDIQDTGIVQNTRVLKSLGHGCDEEAMRVVGLLRFEKVKNRGVRLKITTKTNINFIIPGVRISYTATEKKEQEKQQQEEKPVTYGYTIEF